MIFPSVSDVAEYIESLKSAKKGIYEVKTIENKKSKKNACDILRDAIDCIKSHRVFISLDLSETTIEKVILHDGLKEIGEGTFFNCTSLKKIDIPSTVEVIGIQAFEGSSLESITLHESLKRIRSEAFAGCSSLKSIELPSSVEVIGGGAFQGTPGKKSSLESVILNEGLKEIGIFAFADCTSLKSIELPTSVKLIEPGAFSFSPNKKHSLKTITFKEPHSWYATKDKLSKEKVKTITLSSISPEELDRYCWHRAD